MTSAHQMPKKWAKRVCLKGQLESNLFGKANLDFRFANKSSSKIHCVTCVYQNDDQSHKNKLPMASLRGGGCGLSGPQTLLNPSQVHRLKQVSKIPDYFMRDLKRHLNILIDKANLSYDEREKQQIIISIQWFIAMQEHFNTLCKDSQSASATFEIIFEALPKLLISSITYLRISGFLCLQILQIINDLGRVLFTFFMTNGKRFMKIKDKEYLEELVTDLETQLNIESQNIWVAGAEYEITMIKAVIQSSPSNSDEGQKLLVSFIGGLVKSFLTMSPSDDLIDTLLNGAKFLYKAYQINNLKKKYEVDYYFQSLKWEIIHLLKQNSEVEKIINYLVYAYKTYIENQSDWLLNFCWIRLVSSLLSYRPIISKLEISDNLQEQSKLWNELIRSKYISQFSFNKSIGRLQLFENKNQKPNQQISQFLMYHGSSSFQSFNECLLSIVKFSTNKYFSLSESLGKLDREYLNIILEKSQEVDEYIAQQDKLFAKIKKEIKNINETYHNIQKKNINIKSYEYQIQELQENLETLINLSNISFNQTIVIRSMKQLQIYKFNMIIGSMVAESPVDQQLQKQLEEQIKIFDNEVLQSESKQFIKLVESQTKILNELVIVQIILKKFENNKQDSNVQDLQEKLKNLVEIQTELEQKSKEYYLISIQQNDKQQTLVDFQKKQAEMSKNCQISKYRMNSPLLSLEQTIQKIINISPIIPLIRYVFDQFQNFNFQQESLNTKILWLNALKYLVNNLCRQLIQAKETLLKINNFLKKNISSLQMLQQPIQQLAKDQQGIHDMLKAQFQMILQFFLEEERNILDGRQINKHYLNEILILLKKDFDCLNNLQIENIDIISIRKAIAFTIEFLSKFSAQKLVFLKEQILLIYESINIKIEETNLKQPVMQIERKQHNELSQAIKYYKQNISKINDEIEYALEVCQNIQKGFVDYVQLQENVQNVSQQISLIHQSDNKYFQRYETLVNNQLRDLITTLKKMKLEFPDTNPPQIYLESSTEMLDSLLFLIDQIQLQPSFYEFDDENAIADNIKENIQEIVQNAQDIINDDNYKVRQCFIICLLQMQATTDDQMIVKFCQDKIVQIWGLEKDERVKALLKNPQFLEMQKKLFSCDLQSFSQRIKNEMDEWFKKIEDLETKIHSEGDQEARQKFQEELIMEHKNFEEYLDNINEMESKIDISLQFLKDLKKSLTQIKHKIDNLQETVNVLGDDIRKLRGKSYAELLNIRKKKVLDSMLLRNMNHIYIPLKCQEWDPVNGKQIGNPSILIHDYFENQEGEINEFIQKDLTEKDVLLLRGIAGSGKSRAAGKIEEFFWLQHNQNESVWIPIYISLPTIKDPKFNLIDQALESEFYQFDKIQIREFKEAIQQESLKIILILDSYDEMKQDCIQSNLFHTNRMAQDLFGHLPDTKFVKNYLKVIITTRTEILTSSNYQTWFYGEKLESLKEVELLGFDENQKLKYLQQYTLLCMRKQFLEIHNYLQIKQLSDLLNFWNKVQEFIDQNPSTRQDYLLSEKQANQICSIFKQEKSYRKLSKDQLVSLEKKLIDLWSIEKFQKLITSSQIQHILTTPFMLEIVVQVLPNMTKKYQDASQFKDLFILNFIKVKQQEHKEKQLMDKQKQQRLQTQNQTQSDFDEKQAKIQASTIWDQLENDKYFKKFSLVDKIEQSDLPTIDDANIVIRALKVKELTVFDFYLTFVEFYHLSQIRKQQELGKVYNQESLLIDLLNFSQSLALNMMLRELTQIKFNPKGQLNVQFIQNKNDDQDWLDTYFNDFGSNGDYKKLIRSCILLTQKGSNHSFNHKSIQEFYVGHFILNTLENLPFFDENLFLKFVSTYKWEEKSLQNKDDQTNQQQYLPISDLQMFCLNIQNQLYNSNQFNLSTDSFNGVINLIKEEIKKQKGLKAKLIQLVQLSSISQQFSRASSNSIFLLGQMNEYLGKSSLQNIQLKDTDLLGLSFFDSNLEGSVFNNVNINCCNFNKVNLKNAKWTNIKCNELHSLIVEKDHFQKIIFSVSGQVCAACSPYAVYLCNIQEGKQKLLIDYKAKNQEIFHADINYQEVFWIDSMILSPNESLLAIILFQYVGVYDTLISQCCVISILDIKTGQATHLQCQDKKIENMVFSPDNQFLATCGQLDEIWIWSVQEAKKVYVLKEIQYSHVKSIAYSDDGNILAYCDNQNIYIRKTGNFQQLKILQGYSGFIKLLFQPHSVHLASACNNDIIIWNTITFEKICVLSSQSMVIQLHFLHDGQSIVSFGIQGSIVVWDVREKRQIRCIEGKREEYAFSNNGQYLAIQQDNEIQIWDLDLGKKVTVFEGKSKRIVSMAFQPGDQILVYLNQHEKKIYLLDSQTEKKKNQFDGHQSAVQLITFSTEGQKLASWGNDHTIRIWDVINGKQIAILDASNYKQVSKIVFSQNGQYLFIEQANNTSKLLWYHQYDSLIQINLSPLPEKQEITSNILSQPNGEILAWGVFEGNSIPFVYLWNVKSKTMKKLTNFKNKIETLLFSSDGQKLISSEYGYSVKIWNIQQSIIISQFDNIESFFYTKNNDVLILCTKKNIKVYSVLENTCYYCIDCNYSQYQGKLIFNNIYLAYIKEKIQIWNYCDGREVVDLEFDNHCNYRGFAFSPSDQFSIFIHQGQSIQVWSLQDQKLKQSLVGHESDIKGMIFSSNGQILASYESSGTIFLWEMEKFEKISMINVAKIEKIIFSPDSRIMATAGYYSNIILWSVKDGALMKEFKKCRLAYDFKDQEVAFSPDNNYFVCQNESFIQNVVWDLNKNSEHYFIEGHLVNSYVTFTFDSNILATVMEDGSLITLSNVEQKEFLEVIHNDGTFPHKTIISQDSKILAIYGNDQDIQIWEARTGKLMKKLIGHRHIVSTVCFSPDGLHLISSSWDKTIRIWNIKNLEQTAILNGHKSFIDAIVVSPDSQTLVSVSRDNTIRLWNINSCQEVKIIEYSKQTRRVRNIIFSPDGLMIAWLCPDEKLVYVLTLRDGEKPLKVECSNNKMYSIIDFQQNKLVCSSDCGDMFVDLISGKNTYGKICHSAQHGIIIAQKMSNYCFNLIYDEKNQEFQTQPEHTNEINQLQFSPDCTVISSCGYDGMIKLWNFSQQIPVCYKTLAIYQPLSATLCQIAGAQITSKIGWDLKQLFLQKGAIE